MRSPDSIRDTDVMRVRPKRPGRRRLVLGFAGLLAAVGVAGATGAANPAARYVLTAYDLGPTYTRNVSVSGSRSLEDISVGDSARVRQELRRYWLGGTVAGFNGVSGSRGVISIADVFRAGVPIDDVLEAWELDAARATKGAFERLPSHSPGHHPAFVRGTVLNYDVLLYMWSRGRTIASVEVTGSRGEPTTSLLLELVRRQDAKLKTS